MNIRKPSIYGLVAVLLVALVAIGCSEERKREAAKLESQLRGDTATVAQSDSIAVPDTAAKQLASTTPDTSQLSTITSPATDTPASQPTPIAQKSPAEDSARLASAKTETEPVADVNAIPEENGSVTPKAGMPPQPHDGFTIQVGSSVSESYAQEMAKSFSDRGYQAYVASGTVEGKTYYRVRVGFYGSTNEAKTVLSELKDKYAVDGWIDPVSK